MGKIIHCWSKVFSVKKNRGPSSTAVSQTGLCVLWQQLPPQDSRAQAPYKGGFAKGAEAGLFLTPQVKQRCSELTSDFFCKPDTLKELVFRKHPLKVKSLVPFENLDQKGPGLRQPLAVQRIQYCESQEDLRKGWWILISILFIFLQERLNHSLVFLVFLTER